MEAKADIGPAIKSIHLLSTGSGAVKTLLRE